MAQIKLTWSASQDTLIFDVLNHDLASWFVEKSQSLGNQYSVGDMPIDILKRPTFTEKLIEEELEFIKIVNQGLKHFRMPFTFEEPKDWYDQRCLNRLHKDWVKTRWQWPKLTEIFYRHDKKWFEAYQEMNCHIHLLEDSFLYKFRDPRYWDIENPFKNVAYDWEVCHLYIEYPGHGRQAFEKFRTLDVFDDEDTNNWENIGAFLGMSLLRPYKLNPPSEFLEWCKIKNLVPLTCTLPLANLSDWENKLGQARKIVTKNVKIKDNYFSLEMKE